MTATTWTTEINGIEYTIRYCAPAGRSESAGGGTYAVECGPDHVGSGYPSRAAAERAAREHADVATTTTIEAICRAHGVTLEMSREDASWATSSAMPRSEARALVAALRGAGHEASDAPDSDDPSRSWVHVTAEES